MKLRIATISFLILFMELLFIRLIGTEIRIFAYVSHILLLCIFIGSGLGMLVKKKLPLLVSYFIFVLLTLLLMLNAFSGVTELLSPIVDSFIWYQDLQTNLLLSFVSVVAGFSISLLILSLLSLTFMPLGQYLGELFDASDNTIVAYSINVAFSLLGTLALNLLFYFSISPYIGILLGCALLLYLCVEEAEFIFLRKFVFISFMGLSLASLVFTFWNSSTIWSPYQKLELSQLPANTGGPQGYELNVNNVGYMGLLDLSYDYTSNITPANNKYSNFDPLYLEYGNQYDTPYILKPQPENVLIIGAGGGNDIAGALRAGAKYVDAIEIDPEIIKVGKLYHPENPYNDPRVNVVNQDARAFFSNADKKYDVIVFGLADSHTLASLQTNVQLDNYLYTEESLQQVKSLLKEDGVLSLSFAVTRIWIGERLSANLVRVFGHEPVVFSQDKTIEIYGWGGGLFLISEDPDLLQGIQKDYPRFAQFVEANKIEYGSAETVLTDDWPYLYLRSPKVPNVHLLIGVSVIIILVFLNKRLSLFSSLNISGFLLGTGFLLYEFYNISRSALIFGNTWVTNVYIVSGVLLLVLLANVFYKLFSPKPSFIFVLLALAFVLQFLIPLSFYNGLPNITKYLVAPILMNLPLLFSGMLFIGFLNKVEDKSSFFGSNLFGSAFGGLLSFASYVFGLQSLLFVSIAIYLVFAINLNFLAGKR